MIGHHQLADLEAVVEVPAIQGKWRGERRVAAIKGKWGGEGAVS